MKSLLTIAAAAMVLLLAAPSWAQYSPLISAPMTNWPAYRNGYGYGHWYDHRRYGRLESATTAAPAAPAVAVRPRAR